MNMDDIINAKNIPPIGSTLVDTLDIDNLLNIKEISSKSHVMLDVTNSRIFCELTPGTDLNVPPKNWLYPSLNLPNPIKVKQKNEESSSFYIANMFPECNNKAKIVADAEVIKKLFKIPYNKESVSLMVRKIGNILLIDNFDIANFSGNHEITEENKLSQIEEFLTKLKELNTNLRQAKNSNKKLRQRNMFSKFLFRSVADDTVVKETSNDLTSPDSLPDHSEEVGRVHKFSRIIYWTFEDTQMLIGTNTLNQYFLGSGAIRNVSLHVSNDGKPLNIANAIDIWLENLMCGIPEAVLCVHLGGIVQNYEYIQTQNIPHLLGSQFSLTKIKAYVQGIFSFLLNHEFQRSQIYWLLKCKNANDLKFFNLNMLEATEGQVQIIKTPFDFECGKLFYRFWHYQYYSNTEIERMKWSNTMLLEDSIRTLNRKIHPEIIATANYLIVHLSFSYEIFKTALFEKSKLEFQNCKKQPESVTKRCLGALNNINDGLNCLQYFCESTKNTKRKILKQNIKSNNSFKFNFKLKKTKKQDEVIYINISSLFPKKEYQVLEAFPDWQNINEDRDYWKNYLKLLFYQKAELIFGILAQQYFYCDMFGLCLRSLNMMVRCNKIKIKIDPSSHSIAINPVLIIAGDCCQSFSTIEVQENSMASSSDDNNVIKTENILITDEQYYEIDTNHYGLQLNLINCTKIKVMEKAIEFYKKSLEYEEMDFIRKKLFASNLALAKLYCDELVKARKQTNRLNYFEQSEKYLNQAIHDTARSSLDQAFALFRRAELHNILYNIFLDEMIISSVENNLLVHFKKFLTYFKGALVILQTYNGDNEDCKQELNNNFLHFLIASVTKTWITLRYDSNIKIQGNIRSSMLDCLVSGSEELLKVYELIHTRCKDCVSFIACAMMKWCIGSSLIDIEKIEMRSNLFIPIIKNLHDAIKSFSNVSIWGCYIYALSDQITYMVGIALRTDDSNTPLSVKIHAIEDILKNFCQAGRNFQKIIDGDFIDALFHTTNNTDDEFYKTLIHQFQFQIQYLLSRGTELIRSYSEEKQEFHQFKNCLRMFEGDINRDMDIGLFLTDLVRKLEAMCIEMKFVINI